MRDKRINFAIEEFVSERFVSKRGFRVIAPQ